MHVRAARSSTTGAAMDGSNPEAEFRRELLTRAALVGAALVTVAFAGSALVLRGTAGGVGAVGALTGTMLLALATGLWAGAPDARREELPLRERWLSAAALVALGGSFGSFASLYEQLYPGPWWPAVVLLLAVAAPTYVLALLPPLLLARAERWRSPDDEELAGWGGLGNVVVGVAAGGAVAALLVGLVLLARFSPAFILMGLALLLLLPLFSGPAAAEPPRVTVVFEGASTYGTIRVSEVAFPGERQPERRLYIDEEEESGQLVRNGAPTLAYIAAAEDWFSKVTPSGASYLFLGGGAYTLPRRVAERDRRSQIVVVELDPEVTSVARRFFGLRPQHRIETVHGDARAYLEMDTAASFDRIYMDVYAGNESVPPSLTTVEAAERIAARLRPGGLAAVNLIGVLAGPEALRFWAVVQSYAEVFPLVKLYPHLGPDFADRQNVLLVAGLEADRELPATAGYFEEWPREEWALPEGAEPRHDITLPAAAPAEARGA